MPPTIDKLKPVYEACYHLVTEIQDIARPLAAEHSMTVRDFKVYQHLMQARQQLWEAIDACAIPTKEEAPCSSP